MGFGRFKLKKKKYGEKKRNGFHRDDFRNAEMGSSAYTHTHRAQ